MITFKKTEKVFTGGYGGIMGNFIVIHSGSELNLTIYRRHSGDLYFRKYNVTGYEHQLLSDKIYYLTGNNPSGEKKRDFEAFDPLANEVETFYMDQEYSADFTWFNPESNIIPIYLSLSRERGIYDLKARKMLWREPKFNFYFYDNDILLIDPTDVVKGDLQIKVVASTTGKLLSVIDLESILVAHPEINNRPLSRGFIYQDNHNIILKLGNNSLLSVSRSWNINWFQHLPCSHQVVRDGVIYCLNSKILIMIDVYTGNIRTEEVSDIFNEYNLTFTGSHFSMTEDGWILFTGTTGPSGISINMHSLPGVNIWAFNLYTKELKVVARQSQMPEGALWGTHCVYYRDRNMLLTLLTPEYQYLSVLWERTE